MAHRPEVAPHAGAWIETAAAPETTSEKCRSRPTRARGLKQSTTCAPPLMAAVAPHAGAWIETRLSCVCRASWCRSRPTRARGLKHPTDTTRAPLSRSRPTRARGLKPAQWHISSGSVLVAPHAGAWIETPCSPWTTAGSPVAPHAGAWIETCCAASGSTLCASRPTRARGLKQVKQFENQGNRLVAPHAGAWIETGAAPFPRDHQAVAPHAGAWIETRGAARRTPPRRPGRAPRGRVD